MFKVGSWRKLENVSFYQTKFVQSQFFPTAQNNVQVIIGLRETSGAAQKKISH